MLSQSKGSLHLSLPPPAQHIVDHMGWNRPKTTFFPWSPVSPYPLQMTMADSPIFRYHPMLWGFLIGAVLPIPFYFLARWYPRLFWRYVNIPLVLYASLPVPPFSGPNYASWIVVGWVFQWFMRRFHFRWWMRYNYLLSSGLDVGVVFGLIVQFFAVQLPKGGVSLNWWGNTVWRNTADARWVPLKTLSPGQTFGPSAWS